MPDLFDQPFEEEAQPRDAVAPVRTRRRIVTVAELTSEIRSSLESGFGELWIEGEISNCRVWNTGHVYFTLKDATAQIKGVMFRSAYRYLKFKVEDGLHVVARGRLSVYEPKGEYQLVCEHMEPHGRGALQLAFEQLKRKLQAEGLFDAARKRPIPALPRKIGIVSSLDGAALKDILKVLARRHPNAHLVVRPVRVQGDGAGEDIARALKAITAVPGIDVVIVGRGGGSIEDLWAFNEEAVVRAVAGSAIPVISAVGHETDTTLCDFAADVRAPTPTAAAELAVPVRADLLAQVRELGARAERCTRRTHERASEQLQALLRHWPAQEELLAPQRQRVDELADRLPRALKGRLDRARGELGHAAGALRPGLLRAAHSRAGERLAALWRIAEASHPERPLARGYALVKDRDGHVLTSAKAAKDARLLRLKFRDGEVDAATGDGNPPPRRSASAPAKVDQPKLL